jgi:hypothetical protein
MTCVRYLPLAMWVPIMDMIQYDITLIHNQTIKYHVRFGEDQCKVMVVGDNNTNMFDWQLGKTKLGVCTSYKYLGETITSDKHFESTVQ